MSKPSKLEALAYCIEALCSQSLMEGAGAIRSAIEADPRVWNHLDQRTKDILADGLGLTPDLY